MAIQNLTGALTEQRIVPMQPLFEVTDDNGFMAAAFVFLVGIVLIFSGGALRDFRLRLIKSEFGWQRTKTDDELLALKPKYLSLGGTEADFNELYDYRADEDDGM